MSAAGQWLERVDKPGRFSYWFIATTIVLAAWLHLGIPLVVILFSFFALTKLHFLPGRRRWVAVFLFLFLGAALTYGLALFVNQMVKALPAIADQAIPMAIEWAKKRQMDLPFTDFDSLKETAMDAIKSQVHYLGSFARFARGATSELLLCLIGIVIAIALFLNRGFEPLGKASTPGEDMYSVYTRAIAARFNTFYESFSTVMGAQIAISAVNTALTAIFALIVGLPYALVVVGATFLCGLIPIIGNLLSNTIIVGIGITVSPKMAAFCFIYLVVIHKLEYFLNSKIIGERIRNPFWLTLLGLVLGEKLMGIPGMILAPVILNYIKLEASRIKATDGHK